MRLNDKFFPSEFPSEAVLLLILGTLLSAPTAATAAGSHHRSLHSAPTAATAAQPVPQISYAKYCVGRCPGKCLRGYIEQRTPSVSICEENWGRYIYEGTAKQHEVEALAR